MPPATVLASSTRSQQPHRQRVIASAKPAKPAASKTPAAPPPGSKSASCSPRAVAGIDPHARLAAAAAVPPDGAWIELTPLHDASLRLDASGGRLLIKPVSDGSLAQRFRVHRKPVADNATSTAIPVELTASSTGVPLRVFRALPGTEVKLGSQLSMASAADAQLMFTPALDSSSSGASGPAAVRVIVRAATTDEPSHCLSAAGSAGVVEAVPCDEIATPASQLWRWAAVPAPIAMPPDGSWISLSPATDANASLRASLSVSRETDGDATGSQRFRVQYVARGVPALGDRPQLRLMAASSSSTSSSASTTTSIGWCPSGGDDDDGPSISPAATSAADAATFAFESIDGETFRLLATSSTATDAAYCVAPGARVRVVPASAAAADSAWRWRPAEPWPPVLHLPEDGQWITLTAASTTQQQQQEQQQLLNASSNSDDGDDAHVVSLRPCGDSTTVTAEEGQKFRVHRWPLGPRTLIGLEASSGQFIVAAAGAQNEGAATLGSGLAMYDAHFVFTSHDGATFSIQAIHDPKRPVSLMSSTNEDGNEMPSVGWSRSDALKWTWAPTTPPARRVACIFPATGSIVELVPVQQDAKRLRASGKSAPGVTVADASGSGGGKAAAAALAAERWRVDRTVISGAETVSLASTAVSTTTRLGFTPAGKPSIGAKLQLSTAVDAAASFIVVPAPDGAGFRLTAQQEPGLALDVQSSGAVVLYKRADTRMQQLWRLRVVTAA